jgi:CRP-like cAMP-binding protein
MSIFKLSADSDLQVVLRNHASEIIQHKAHEVLFQEGRRARGCYLILDGKVELHIEAKKKKNRLNSVLGAGCLVGLPATINGQAYSLSCEIVEDAKLALLSRKDLTELMKSDTSSAIKLLELLSIEVQSLRHDIAKSSID